MAESRLQEHAVRTILRLKAVGATENGGRAMAVTINLSGAGETFDLIPAHCELPFETVQRGSKAAGCFLTAFGLFFAGIPAFGVIMAVVHGGASPAMLFVLPFIIIGIVVFIIGISQFVSTKRWAFTEQGIECNSKGISGEKEWSEPWAGYQGVLSEEEYHSGGKNSPSYTLYKLVLKHRDDEDKSVDLYSSRAREGWRGQQERHARLFGVPALVETADGMMERQPEDLDKSVRELVQEGQMEVSFDPSAPPPGQRLTVTVDGRFLRISVRGAQMPAALRVVFGLTAAAGVVMAAIGFGRLWGAPIILGIIGTVMFAGDALILAAARLIKPELSASPEVVQKCFLTPWGAFGRQEIPTSAIEEVTVRKQRSQNSPTIVRVVTDAATIDFGLLLGDEEKRWVRDCVVAVISAPSVTQRPGSGS